MPDNPHAFDIIQLRSPRANERHDLLSWSLTYPLRQAGLKHTDTHTHTKTHTHTHTHTHMRARAHACAHSHAKEDNNNTFLGPTISMVD